MPNASSMRQQLSSQPPNILGGTLQGIRHRNEGYVTGDLRIPEMQINSNLP